MGQTRRARAEAAGWLHLEAPGQTGHLYLKEGDEVTLTFEPETEAEQ